MTIPIKIKKIPANTDIYLMSFSSGRTSAKLTYDTLRKYNCAWCPEKELHIGSDPISKKTVWVIVAFANTSREDEGSLFFVYQCDNFFNFHTAWLESVVNPIHRKGTTCKMVNYETAKRKGEVFTDVIAKFGIPNAGSHPHCTRELKQRPTRDYMRKKGFSPKHYKIIIGYRIDEPERWNEDDKIIKMIRERHVYPYVFETPQTKIDVNYFWKNQLFDLKLGIDIIPLESDPDRILDHYGNCKLCLKKSDFKIIARIGEDLVLGEADNWEEEMEIEFGEFTPESRIKKAKPPYRFFRKNQRYIDLKNKALELYKEAVLEENPIKKIIIMETISNALIYAAKGSKSGCEESCEAF